MPVFDRLPDLIRAVGDEALAAGRRANEADPHECDVLLAAILAADEKMSRASAYLRKAARPRSITGFGESHDRLRETMDESQIILDQLRDDDEPSTSDGELRHFAEWQDFLTDHPELESVRESAQQPPRLEFTDDDLIAAATEAIRQWDEYFRSDGRAGVGGVHSRSVADVLGGNRAVGKAADIKIAVGDVVRVGQALGRLARAGRLVLVNKSYEPPRYALPD